MDQGTAAILLVGILVLAYPAHAQLKGESEVSIEQGQLAQVKTSLRPEPGLEARAWWQPDRGGAGWLRWNQLQVGPLLPVAAPEGRRAWGPGSRLSSGHWGLSFDGRPLGFWAVQGPDSLELGAQLRTEGPAWLAAAGGERVWSLGDRPSSPWLDRLRAGFSWALGGWQGAVEAAASGSSEAAWATEAQVRGGWSWPNGEVLATFVTDGSWSAVGAWAGAGARLRLRWESVNGSTLQVGYELPWQGVDYGGRLEVRSRDELTWLGGASIAGALDGARWRLDVEFQPGVVGWEHRWSATWSRAGFEAEARLSVEGPRLGWLGSGTKVELNFRWPF